MSKCVYRNIPNIIFIWNFTLWQMFFYMLLSHLFPLSFLALLQASACHEIFHPMTILPSCFWSSCPMMTTFHQSQKSKAASEGQFSILQEHQPLNNKLQQQLYIRSVIISYQIKKKCQRKIKTNILVNVNQNINSITLVSEIYSSVKVSGECSAEICSHLLSESFGD